MKCAGKHNFSMASWVALLVVFFLLRYPLVTSLITIMQMIARWRCRCPYRCGLSIFPSYYLSVCLSVHPLRLSVCLCIYILLSFWYYLCPPLCVRAFRFVPLQFSHSYYNRFYRFFIIGSRIFQLHLLKKSFICVFLLSVWLLGSFFVPAFWLEVLTELLWLWHAICIFFLLSLFGFFLNYKKGFIS